MAILLDSLLIGGIRFVLSRVVDAVDAELNDEGRLREELLATHMRFELGELDEESFAAAERDLLARLRDIRARKGGGASISTEPGAFRVTGAEASVEEGHDR